VFGSSRPRPGEPEYQLAYALGRELAAAGFAVCNGGYGGIMEATARGAKSPAPRGSAGAEAAEHRTIGVTCSSFPGRQANHWIDEVVSTETLFERLNKLIAIGDAYIVLKGGTGTLLEFAAVWELMNKTMMQEKPIVLVGDFWSGLVRTLKEELAREEREDCTRYVTVVATPEEAARLLKNTLTGGANEF
jgi:uncharacterized protein (TIGR00730 family)